MDFEEKPALQLLPVEAEAAADLPVATEVPVAPEQILQGAVEPVLLID